MTELLHVDIPASARCPHTFYGRFIECHEPIPVKRKSRKGQTTAHWKCAHCLREVHYDEDYRMYVLPYLIEEVPW